MDVAEVINRKGKDYSINEFDLIKILCEECYNGEGQIESPRIKFFQDKDMKIILKAAQKILSSYPKDHPVHHYYKTKVEKMKKAFDGNLYYEFLESTQGFIDSIYLK